MEYGRTHATLELIGTCNNSPLLMMDSKKGDSTYLTCIPPVSHGYESLGDFTKFTVLQSNKLRTQSKTEIIRDMNAQTHFKV